VTPVPVGRVEGPPVRVLVADEHAPMRMGLRDSLEGEGFVICVEATDAPAALAAALRERPDACLLDVNMPGNGIWAAREITARLPETAVVMLTSSESDADLFDALRAGAAGYLPNDMDPARLPQALRGVLAGEAALPRRLVARLIDEFRSHERRRQLLAQPHRGAELTSREWEVLELMGEGLTTAGIAERLFVSPVTVRRHISSLLKKLGLPNREAALRLLDEPA
jgi:DNA-binding NarL/FixJ family response regulator